MMRDRGALLACDLPNLELLLTNVAKGGRTITCDGRTATLEPPLGPSAKPLAHELLAAAQPALLHAWRGAVPIRDDQGKMRPAHHLVACDHCVNWFVQTTTQAKTNCKICGAKGPRRRLEIPWTNAKRGRPDVEVREVPIEENDERSTGEPRSSLPDVRRGDDPLQRVRQGGPQHERHPQDVQHSLSPTPLGPPAPTPQDQPMSLYDEACRRILAKGVS